MYNKLIFLAFHIQVLLSKVFAVNFDQDEQSVRATMIKCDQDKLSVCVAKQGVQPVSKSGCTYGEL